MPTVPFHAPGITYNGLHSTVNPTAAQVSADLATTKQHFGHVRTYYPQYGGGAVDVGKLAKDAGLNLMLGLFLFDGHPDWIEGNYQQFVKPAAARGNITAILIGNEDPQMIDTITQYLQKAKADLPQVPVGTSQTIGFWLTDGRAAQLLPLVDFIGVNIYPAWDWTRADANNQPIGVTPESGFNSFRDTYNQIQTKYSGRQIVVTETGWPTTFGPIPAQQFPNGISNARDYLNRVIAWAQAQQVVVYIHNMFDDQYGVDTSSPFNYHFGLIDYAGNPKGFCSNEIEDGMHVHERMKLWLVGLMLSLLLSGAAEAADKNKTVRITNRQGTQAQVYINFAADSALKPTDVPFCKVTGPLNCEFTLAANSSRDIPNPQAKYLNMALAFNAQVTCGSTKAEVLVNNPNWFDILDVSVVDGFNEKIQINLTPTGGSTTQLGPPVGKLGNQKVFGVFPYGCTICAGIKNAPCGDSGGGECKSGSESKPDVLCQYQMNEPTGLVEVLLLPQ